jgi:steroid delta-isomerase-like uncharacterized protein
VDAAEVINSLIAAWNERDKETFVNGYGDDCEITSPGGVVLRGRDGVEAFWHGYQDAFPDNRIIVGTVFGTGEEAVEEAVFEGTHTGPLRAPDGQEIPATGRRASTPFSQVFTLRDGRVARARLYFDQVDLLSQLGLMPTSQP